MRVLADDESSEWMSRYLNDNINFKLINGVGFSIEQSSSSYRTAFQATFRRLMIFFLLLYVLIVCLCVPRRITDKLLSKQRQSF